MAIYLYLSLFPESLIAAMLPPEEFGQYMAIGTKKDKVNKKPFSLN